MNFKTTLLIAGALAVANATEYRRSNRKTHEEAEASSQALVERCSRASMSVNPSKCARCRGAPKRRSARFAAMYRWRNAQNKSLAAWWRGRLAYRTKMMNYWSRTWWSAQVRTYQARARYINKIYASWYKSMQYNYNHCK